MYQLDLPLNRADYQIHYEARTPGKSNALDIMNAVMGVMGLDLNTLIAQAMEKADSAYQALEMSKAEARRQQIKKFNKRKAQRRAYTGRKHK